MQYPSSATERSKSWREDLFRKGWYHSFELPDGRVIEGVLSVDRLRQRVGRYGIPDDLRGKRVLDIGTWDGWFAFEMERRGAEVAAIDCVEIENFSVARRLLGSRVKYIEMDVLDISPANLGYFDIVLFLGVLYHLKHPLLALEKVCAITKELAIVESFVTDDSSRTSSPFGAPVMEFYETNELAGEFDNWSGPNVPCLMAFCRTAGFARVELRSHDEDRACVACYRKWDPPSAPPSTPVPYLRAARNNLNYGFNFYTNRDEYISCWMRSEELDLTRYTVFPTVGEYGVAPIHVTATGVAGVWQVTFKLPPGLTPGWWPVMIRTSKSPPSNPVLIVVDVPPVTAGLRFRDISDSHTWVRNEVEAGENSYLSFWVDGLPDNADSYNIRVYLDEVRQFLDYLGEPEPDGYRQINIKLRDDIHPGKQKLIVRFGDYESEPSDVLVRRR